MGTVIELKVGGISLDYSKNHIGNDWGYLFQEGDLIRRCSNAIDYANYDEHPEEAEELKVAEETLVRPLSRVLSRLAVLGHSLDKARAEYNAILTEAASMVDNEEEAMPPLTFEEFCSLATRFPISELTDTYVEYQTENRDIVAQGRLNVFEAEFSRIPWTGYSDEYWSEKSYLASKVCVLTPTSMLLIFGLNSANLDAEVEWEFGPIVDAGWVKRDEIQPGARRFQPVLVVTEGASDARILRRALELLRPDVADFFQFIDGDERHHFWGTGNLVKFAQGLLRIDIQNRVLFLLDNDAEGVEAFNRLQKLLMPSNLRSMVLPTLEELSDFSALGPEGLNSCDINGRAAAIECYLDLNHPQYPPACVVWSNYKKESNTWQGALEYKDSYVKHFMDQDSATLIAGPYDTSKLTKLLDALIAEAAIVV